MDEILKLLSGKTIQHVEINKNSEDDISSIELTVDGSLITIKPSSYNYGPQNLIFNVS